MQYLLNLRYDGTASINFVGSEVLDTNNRTLILKTEEPIVGITGFNNFKDTVVPNDNNIIRKFKYKLCENWSDLIDISELTGITFNENCHFELELYYFFVNEGNLSAPAVTISNVTIEAIYNIEKTSGIVTLTENGNPIILEPKDIYKIFDLSDFQASVGGLVDENDLDIKFRITQDGGYTFTKWTPLTKENLSVARKDINELRFAKVQYLITKNSTTPVTVYDIMLIGDFQNVSANYLKTNRYGLREDCVTKLSETNSSSTIENNLINNGDTNGLSCYTSGNNESTLSGLTSFNNDNNGLWNPYKQSPEITNFYNFLANQTNSIFGWDVEYFKTDPDGNGIDTQIHEYGLFNVYKKDTIKIIVPENQFPDNTIQLNVFNLDLFDTFEVQILKDVFKEKFGIEERPAVKDFLFFCVTNRLYTIKHAQIYKDIMHTGIYYKVILEKYEERANILVRDQAAKNAIESLTDNTTIDDLFGFENKQDEDKVANKVQFTPKSFEKIRQSISSKVSIMNEPVYNGEVDFIKYYYNFNKLIDQKSVEYKNVDNNFLLSDNRCFINWFKFNSYFDENSSITKRVFDNYQVNINKNFMLLDNYNETNNIGYRYYYNNKKINFILNNNSYELETPNLLTNIWYGIVINLDQRQRTLDIRVYKRLTDVYIALINPTTYERQDIISTDITGITSAMSDGFKPVANFEYGSTAVSEFILLYQKIYTNIDIQEFNHDVNIKLIGSDISYSNLRIFNDIIEEKNINNILNQNIIKDAGKLIIADNANRKIYTNNIENKNFR
jgi:hypothetical protein